MIRYITLTELNEIRNRDDHKAHNHEYENVFLYHPGQGMLNPRAYKICKFCGQMVEMQIDDKIHKEIDDIIREKFR